MFHEDGGIEEESAVERNGESSDLGPKSDKEWDDAWNSKLQEESRNGLRISGFERQGKIVRERSSGVRFLLNGG